MENIGMIIQLSTHVDSFTLAVKKSGEDSPPLLRAAESKGLFHNLPDLREGRVRVPAPSKGPIAS